MKPSACEKYAPVYRVVLARDNAPGYPTVEVTPAKAVEIAREYLRDADRENMIVLMLDKKNKLIGINTVSQGTLDAVPAEPREIFKPAILHNAHGIILAHNHPSGDAKPSPDDHRLFNVIRQAGDILRIPLLDALILGDGTNQHYSLRTHVYGTS